MRLPLTLLLALLAHHSVRALTPAKRHYSTHDYYVLEHDSRGGGSLDEIARALGVEVIEQAGALRDHWLVRAEKPISSLTTRDTATDHVMAALERLRTTAASRRDSHFSRRSTETQHAKRLVKSIKYFSPQTLRRRVKRAPPPIPSQDRPADANSTARAVALRLGIQDPLFSKQWHIINEEYPQHMMNVTPLWDMGITGKGVISALVDDGLDYRSDDIAANFVSFCIAFRSCLF
jgi:kexin